jgi:hypothetical protein
MTVQRLIEELEQMNPNAEVRFAAQPNWPFEYDIDSVVQVDVEDRRIDDTTEVVYLEEGRQIGYLPGEAARELGWKD